MKLFAFPLVLLSLVFAAALHADEDPPTVVPLWAQGAPGSEARRNEPEQARDYWVRNIHNPTLTVYLPPKEKATGAAVVIIPGGGHRELVFQAEGVEAAQYFRSLGIACFVLKYRLAREEGSTYTIERDARADALRAMRTVRARAQEWGIDPHRVGIIGFSAGGELAALVSFGPNGPHADAPDAIDRPTARPDFAVFIYPGPLGFPEKVAPDAPPAFFLASVNDHNPATTIAQMLERYRDAKVPVEVHLYSHAAHAFNMGHRTEFRSIRHWPDRVADWIFDAGFLFANATPNAGSQ